MTTTTETTTEAVSAIWSATPSAVAIAVLVYRTSSRKVRRIMATEPATEARDTATLIRRRDAAWRYLRMTGNEPFARMVINEEVALLRIADRRRAGEDTSDLFGYLGQTRAYLRQDLAALRTRQENTP